MLMSGAFLLLMVLLQLHIFYRTRGQKQRRSRYEVRGW